MSHVANWVGCLAKGLLVVVRSRGAKAGAVAGTPPPLLPVDPAERAVGRGESLVRLDGRAVPAGLSPRCATRPGRDRLRPRCACALLIPERVTCFPDAHPQTPVLIASWLPGRWNAFHAGPEATRKQERPPGPSLDTLILDDGSKVLALVAKFPVRHLLLQNPVQQASQALRVLWKRVVALP